MRSLLRFIQRYYNLLLFLLLEAVAVSLIIQGTSFQRSRLVSLNRQVSGYIYGKVDGVREYFHLKEINRQLYGENLDLRNRLDGLHQRLDSSLVITVAKEERQYDYVPAKVVHNSVYKQYNYITIDRGEKDGVFRDMGVISESGLVGIVMATSRNFATVIPVINRDFRLSVKIESNNYSGILRWEGDSPRYAILSEIPFHVGISEGDTIVTSGFSAIFPEGIEAGIIDSYVLESGNFYDIRIRLFTRFQSLFHVNVIRNHRQVEQLHLEELPR